MPQFFTAADGTRLAYDDQGSGLPLLCLSGLTRTMGDFDYLRPHLPPPNSGKLRLIRMDYRGRGASGHSGADSYTVAQEGADALALLDHLGLPQAAILGTSRGGLIDDLDLAARACAVAQLVDLGGHGIQKRLGQRIGLRLGSGHHGHLAGGRFGRTA